MSPSYPYILVPKALEKFLRGVPDRGVPEKITTKTLEALGLKSKNHRAIIPILRFIDFVDPSGTPTDRYKAFRDRSKGPALMAQTVREVYADLFQMHGDAHEKDNEALRNFFASVLSRKS